ncbi:MAG: DNA-methyltransferase [Pirellulaceae bacterium]
MATKTKKTSATLAEKFTNKIVCGDILDVVETLTRDFADTIVTSPPYFRQRDYGDGRQLGREKEPQDYVDQLASVFEKLMPVVKPGGSLWLVLGDKYVNGELQGMPWRVALALKDVGWHLRSDVIWHKPNAMPSSTKSRPTTDHEYVFFFTRSKDYFYDADAIREPHVTFSEKSRMKGGRKHLGKRGGTPEQGKNSGNNNLHDGRWDQAFHPKGRNKRTVWSIPLGKFREAHFAVFPTTLVENCIKAACPPGGLVLDPFCGSGTTALVARQLDRNYLGVDCSSEYCKLARRRLNSP